MYFLASKIIGFFGVPSNFILILALSGLLLWRTRFSQIGKSISVASIILLLIVEVLPIGTLLLLPLENRFQPWDLSSGPPTGIIVLGGVINPAISVQRGNISLGDSSERIIAAAELYHRYPTARFVFSGGSGDLMLGEPPESEFAARLMADLGIPRKDIELESSSRNTMENAIGTLRLVMPKPGERWLLITSAYHMPRAVGLFRSAGFPIEAYPVDWKTGGWIDLATQPFFSGGFYHLDLAIHEWAGLIFDRLSGRTSVFFPGP